MSATIEWTDKTWNPVTGCSKVSPGCAHCYAETVAVRFWKTQYADVEVAIGSPDATNKSTWTRPREFTDVLCHEDRLTEPLRWRTPSRIFVNSMSDLFHEDVPDAFIDRVFAVMALSRRHTHQVLTKRAHRMHVYMTSAGLAQRIAVAMCSIPGWDRVPAIDDFGNILWRNDGSGRLIPAGLSTWPLPNVWLGVSVENQHFADERIPLLLETPAAIRFISAEPLLGPVKLYPYLPVRSLGLRDSRVAALDWVIVGGESGPGSRPFDLAWARAIVQQCKSAGVACFVKQLGKVPVETFAPNCDHFLSLHNKKGGDITEFPADLRVREFPTPLDREERT